MFNGSSHTHSLQLERFSPAYLRKRKKHAASASAILESENDRDICNYALQCSLDLSFKEKSLEGAAAEKITLST